MYSSMKGSWDNSTSSGKWRVEKGSCLTLRMCNSDVVWWLFHNVYECIIVKTHTPEVIKQINA